MLKKFIVVLGIALAACQSNSNETPEATLTPEIAAPLAVTPESAGRWSDFTLLQPGDSEFSVITEPIYLSIQGLRIGLTPPRGWEVYTADDAIVLAERMGSLATGGELEGVLVHLFVPSLDGLNVPMSDGTNVAHFILEQMTESSPYAARGLITEPEAFIWKSCYAAYYLVNGGNSIYTLVLAVIPTGTDELLAISISAPSSRAADIRPTLMKLVQSLSVNSIYLDSASLRILPNPLVFPDEEPSLNAGFVLDP